jgi:Icc-related predicted phosphoesterase
MTRLWVLSDLHLEAVRYPEAFQPVRPAFDVLVVAGDIWEGDSERALRIVARLAGGKPAVFVMGNHEHWDGVLHRGLAEAKRQAERLGVTLLDGNAVDLAGVRFLGGTLWADGRLSGIDATPDQETGERIDVAHAGGTRRITVGDAIGLHRKTRRAFDRLLAAPRDDRKVVVVTHHAPHPLCLPPEVRSAWVAGISASDLSGLIGSGQVDLWVHGHIHARIDITHASGTRIICNAAGPGFHNLGFQEDWTVEV